MPLPACSRISRRRFVAGAGALAVLAGGLPARARQQAVALQLSWLHSVQFAGSYVADQRGYWAAEGLDVSLAPGGPNAPVEPPVAAGTALVGVSAADYAANAVAEGAPFRIVGVAMQKNPFAIASLATAPVRSPADLPGRRIGMALANTPVLRALCRLNGVDVDAVEIVPTQYDVAPLITGQVDCLLCWETDLPVAMTVRGIDNVTMLLADHGYSIHSQAYIATTDSIANRRPELVGLLRGEARGWTDVAADMQGAVRLTLDRFPDQGLDPAVQALQLERQMPLMLSDDTRRHGFGWYSEELVRANVETLGLLGRSVTPALWDRTLIEEAHGR